MKPDSIMMSLNLFVQCLFNLDKNGHALIGLPVACFFEGSVC